MKKKKVSSILAWFFSIIFILGALGNFGESVLVGIFCMAFGISLCPAFWRVLDKWHFQKWKKVTLSVVCLFALMFVMPKTESTTNQTDNVQTSAILEETVPEAENGNTEGKANQEQDASQKEADLTAPASDNLEETEETIGKMEVHFLDVGQADCILVSCEGHFMLVDAGNNEDGETIISYLKNQGVSRLDYVIATHPHEDHIGSLDAVINNFEITNLLMPSKAHTTATFEDVVTAIENHDLSITTPIPGDTYALGSGEFTILAPVKEDYGDDLNNWSVGIKLVHGANSIVMCGDAEEEAERDICENGLDISADVLKLGHHGSSTSTSEAFLQAVNPKYAIISCGEGNDYGHPHKETLEKLAAANIQVFRTDEQGTIILESDGSNISFNVEPSTTMKQGEAAEEDKKQDSNEGSISNTPDDTDNSSIEVHITNTGSKYHSAGCRYLKQSDIVVTLSQAKAKGLTPCSKCHPPN